jgi:hypothetical protein
MSPLKKLEEIESFDDLTHKQWIALGKIIGGLEIVKQLLWGDVVVGIEKALKPLFDKNGRRIPPRGLQGKICDPEGYNFMEKLQFTKEVLARALSMFKEAFRQEPTLDLFKKKTTELLDEIKSSKELENLLGGFYFPIILPKINSKDFDYGTVLREIFFRELESISNKYAPIWNQFHSPHKSFLDGPINLVLGSRHETIVEKMKQGIVYAIYFPYSLRGFSVVAARKQMASLPESLSLAGGFDTAAALIMYPRILTNSFGGRSDRNTHLLSALSDRSSGEPFYMSISANINMSREVDPGGIYFSPLSRDFLDKPDGRESSGLLFIGNE